MRYLVSCFDEYAVSAADASCYGSSGCIEPSIVPSILNVVTNLYRVIYSNQKQITITVAWSKSQMSEGLSISLSDSKVLSFKLNINSRLLRKTKGSKIIDSADWKIEVCWDFSAARYQSSPEPSDGYYLLVMVDSELALVLGTFATEEKNMKMKNISCTTKVSLVARKEQCSGNTLYATKAKFCEAGTHHEILIKCTADKEGVKYPVLSISIDKKTVIRVKRLQWNFRGNQSIFIDGLMIDVLWDVHDWLFLDPSCGQAVFMFRTRHSFDNRLWLEKKTQKEQENVDFSLVIHASLSHRNN